MEVGTASFHELLKEFLDADHARPLSCTRPLTRKTDGASRLLADFTPLRHVPPRGLGWRHGTPARRRRLRDLPRRQALVHSARPRPVHEPARSRPPPRPARPCLRPPRRRGDAPRRGSPLLPDPAQRAARVAAGLRANPVRVALSRTLDLPIERALGPRPDAPVYVFTVDQAPRERVEALEKAGIEVREAARTWTSRASSRRSRP